MYFSREPGDDSLGGRLNFLKFETERIDACIEFMRKLQADQKQDNGTKAEELCVMATGGGAFKYYDRVTEALGVKVIREDEMECLIIGMRGRYCKIVARIANMVSDRSRLLHQRDPGRSVHIQRRRAHDLHDTST